MTNILKDLEELKEICPNSFVIPIGSSESFLIRIELHSPYSQRKLGNFLQATKPIYVQLKFDAKEPQRNELQAPFVFQTGDSRLELLFLNDYDSNFGVLQWFLVTRIKHELTKYWKIKTDPNKPRNKMNSSPMRRKPRVGGRESTHMDGNGGITDDGMEISEEHGNFFVDLYKNITSKLDACFRCCLICDSERTPNSELPICEKDSCKPIFSIANSSPVHANLRVKSEIVELFVELLSHAASSKSFQNGLEKSFNDFGFVFQTGKLVSFEPFPHNMGFDYDGVEDLSLLLKTLQNFPSTSEMLLSPSDEELKKTLDKKSRLCFPLLQWILNEIAGYLSVMPREAILVLGASIHLHLNSKSKSSLQGQFSEESDLGSLKLDSTLSYEENESENEDESEPEEFENDSDEEEESRDHSVFEVLAGNAPLDLSDFFTVQEEQHPPIKERDFPIKESKMEESPKLKVPKIERGTESNHLVKRKSEEVTIDNSSDEISNKNLARRSKRQKFTENSDYSYSSAELLFTQSPSSQNTISSKQEVLAEPPKKKEFEWLGPPLPESDSKYKYYQGLHHRYTENGQKKT